jgi:hypothetical protein
MSVKSKLLAVQSELKAPKGQFNSFGKYKYRSCEDILEAVKPLLVKHGLTMTISDKIEEYGGRVYVKSEVSLSGNSEGENWVVTAYAREEDVKKGMDASQVTGASSSYARKYALNGMFLIDDTKDSDATNTHGQEPAQSHGRVPVGGAAARDAIAEEEAAQDKEVSIMDKAVAFMKTTRNRQQGYESVMKHYGDQLSDGQKEALKKFIR